MTEATNYPFVSVVVPCFNSLVTIGDCLDALQHQTYPPDFYEVIVADNGSGDGSRELIAKDYPTVRAVSASQKGSAYARNAGLHAAKGALILSTDADCVPDREWIAALVTAFEAAGPRIGAIGGSIEPYSVETLTERYRKAWVSQPPADTKVLYAATTNAVFSAQALRELGGFDGEAGHDDSDMGIRLTKAGYSILYSETAKVRHRNPDRLSDLFHHRRKYGKANFALAEKHSDLFGSPIGVMQRRRLLKETIRRVASSILKLPISLLSRSPGRPRGWPLVDATMALGNYSGFRQASLTFEKRKLQSTEAKNGIPAKM